MSAFELDQIVVGVGEEGLFAQGIGNGGGPVADVESDLSVVVAGIPDIRQVAACVVSEAFC